LRKRLVKLFARLIDSAALTMLNRDGGTRPHVRPAELMAMNTPRPLFNGDTPNTLGGLELGFQRCARAGERRRSPVDRHADRPDVRARGAGAMSAPLEFRSMLAGDAVLLELQPSQHYELGRYHAAYTLEEGEELAENGDAWTAHRGSRIVTIAGFRELFPGHAVVWASHSAELGADHLAITRFARWQIENSRFRRLEAIVDAADDRASPGRSSSA
jgi:hypothetical protein